MPTLGLDALGPASYGPEAALTILLPVGTAGLACVGPVSLVILILLAILHSGWRVVAGMIYPDSLGVARRAIPTWRTTWTPGPDA